MDFRRRLDFVGKAKVKAAVLVGRHSLVALEGFDEVAEVVEAAIVGHVDQAFLSGPQLVAGLVDSKGVEIFNGRAVGHLAEDAAKILGRHSCA